MMRAATRNPLTPEKKKANRTLEAVGFFLRPVAAEAAPALKESG
jgi:hypothetical protein